MLKKSRIPVGNDQQVPDRGEGGEGDLNVSHSNARLTNRSTRNRTWSLKRQVRETFTTFVTRGQHGIGQRALGTMPQARERK